MTPFRFSHQRALALGLTTLLAAAAQATPYELIYTGSFSSEDALNLASAATPTYFTGTTAFTVVADFDTSSPNLAPPLGGPFDGFRAYATTSATLLVGGTSYGIESATADTTTGVTVSIFDKTSLHPGEYGIGLIVDPGGDGGGFIASFSSATPEFTVASLTATTFGNYNGVGYISGTCTSGSGPTCPRGVTPLVLSGPGGDYSLTLGNYGEDYPSGTTLNTAVILATAVPEPATYGLMLAGLGSLALTVRRRRHAVD